MKKLFIISLILLSIMSSIANSARRDIKALAEDALRRGVFSAPPADHDFTRIPMGASYEEGELLVRFAPIANERQRTVPERNYVLQTLGGGVLKHNYDIVPGLSIVQLPQGQTVERALVTFNRANGILFAEPNYHRTVCSTTPNDTKFNELWGMHNTGQKGGTPDADIDAPEAWGTATGDGSIIVAVIDTGVNYNHEDLKENMWVNEDEKNGTTNVDDDDNGYIDDIYGYDFRNNDGNPMDDHGHGTHCSGTIGAVGNNGKGVAGVCWDVKIMAMKFLNSTGNGDDTDAIDCIEYAIEMGAHVLSNSWGGFPYNQDLKNAIELAEDNDILFVAAAGNYKSNNDYTPFYPASYSCSNIIAVLSTTYEDALSSFSNYGSSSVDLGAPGSDILSCSGTSGYTYNSGTSMSTPHVAGACALLLSINPSLDYDDIKDILIDNVDVLGSLNGKCVSDGRLNLYNAICDSRIYPPAHILAINSLEEGLVWFDEQGNLCLNGNFTEQGACTQTGYDGFKVRNSSGTTVIMTVDADDGDVCISGSCYETQDSLNPPSGSRFIIKNSSSNVIAYIDSSGNLYLKGEVYEL